MKEISEKCLEYESIQRRLKIYEIAYVKAPSNAYIYDIAILMLEDGFAIETISKYTGLSERVIASLSYRPKRKKDPAA